MGIFRIFSKKPVHAHSSTVTANHFKQFLIYGTQFQQEYVEHFSIYSVHILFPALLYPKINHHPTYGRLSLSLGAKQTLNPKHRQLHVQTVGDTI